MKRIVVLAVLVACGDDEQGPARDAGAATDASGPVHSMDAAIPRVLNVGAACTSDRGCVGGADAVCANATLDNIDFPGGYCTASCLRAADCGPGAECPFGELVAALGVGHVALAGLTAGQCLESCSELGSAGSCRAGYVCSSFGATSPLAVDLPAFERPVCLPRSARDGGITDASALEDAAR